MPRAAQRQRTIRFALACLLTACTALAPARAGNHASTHAAPSFKLPALTGTVNLDSLRGHVVYLDFWASWCGPCRASFPWMAGLDKKYRAKGLEIVAVNLDKDRALADAFLADYPAPFTIAFDPKGGTAEAYGVSAMPSSFVIGKDGKILLRHAGFDPQRTGQVELQIEEALGK
jgi:thiol-disulfide isomerase/thioredoxin